MKWNYVTSNNISESKIFIEEFFWNWTYFSSLCFRNQFLNNWKFSKPLQNTFENNLFYFKKMEKNKILIKMIKKQINCWFISFHLIIYYLFNCYFFDFQSFLFLFFVFQKRHNLFQSKLKLVGKIVFGWKTILSWTIHFLQTWTIKIFHFWLWNTKSRLGKIGGGK